LAVLDRAWNEPPHRRREESLPANVAQAIAWGAGVVVVAEWLDDADGVDSNRPDA
jgi:hypothetical protein